MMFPAPFYMHSWIISLALFAFLLFEFIRGFGERIHPLELMGIYAILNYLLAPSLSYHLQEIEWYEGYNSMCIPKEEYLAIAYPSIFLLLAGLYFPFKIAKRPEGTFYDHIKAYLSDKTDAGFKLFWIGMAATFLSPFLPGMLGFITELASQLIYIGGLYIWFSPLSMRQKVPYLAAVVAMPLLRALQAGMFGEIVFWGIFMGMVMALRYHVAFWKKLALAIFGVAFLLFVQSVKYEFRLMTWFSSDETTAKLSYRVDLMKDLWTERIKNPDLLLGPVMLSAALDRANQGMLTAMSIRYVPAHEPFANGETIFKATAASFVPRFLWPNKPSVGSRDKMIRFTGFDNGEYTAMDIGQLGDAYVNFGKWGGAIFLFSYGLFFAFCFMKIFDIGYKGTLSLTLWIPLFFVGVVNMDSSVLACFNHIIKAGMFAAVFFWGYKKFFDSEL